MKCILIPVDGSNASIRALDQALARKKNGERFEVAIINVQPDIRGGRMINQEEIKYWQMQESAKALGKAAVKKRIQALKAKTSTTFGDPAELIVETCKKSKCSEIIMGTRGLNRLAGLVLGSVATKVIHMATVPVTLVK